MNLCPYCGRQQSEKGCCLQAVRNERDHYREAIESLGCRTPHGYGCQDHPQWADNRAMWCWVCNVLYDR